MFVAEVPGPEDKIMVRLIDGVCMFVDLQTFQRRFQLKDQIVCKYMISNTEMVF